MDRISSCATSSSSETRISLLVPSGVANLSAMEIKYVCLRLPLSFAVENAKNKERDKKIRGNINLYCSFSIIELQRSLTSLGVTIISTSADKQGRTGSSSFQFILSGFDVVWR